MGSKILFTKRYDKNFTTERIRAYKTTKRSEAIKKETADSSSDFPILARIARNQNSVAYRTVWALTLLMCCALCTYQVWDRVSFYLSSPIGILVRTSRNETIRYPMLTVCTMDTTGQIRLRKNYERLTKIESCSKPSGYRLPDFQRVLNLNYTMLMKNVNITEDLAPLCVLDAIKNEDYNTFRKWCIEVSSTSFSGSCYSISHRYPPKFSTDNFFGFAGPSPPNSCHPAFLWVLIHEDMFEVVFNSICRNEYFSVEYLPKIKETIPIAISEFTYLNTPKNPCTDEDSYKTCIQNYLKRSVEAAKLRCTFPFLGPSSLNICEHWSDLYKAEQAMRKVFNPYKHPCPRKCHETIYRRGSIQIRRSFAEKYYVGLEFLDNIISVSEEYYAYSFISLLCDVGGNIGLYLGVSLVSLFEALEGCWKQFNPTRGKKFVMRLNH